LICPIIARFLNKALIEENEFDEHIGVCSASEVEETKAVVRLIPIWTACLMYGIVFAQTSTFFTKQGATMERTIVPGFKRPAASLQCIVNIIIVTFIPIYDRVLVKIARGFTGKPSGITMLQRIGIGIFISVFSMIISALVETRRLKIAEEHGLVDDPSSTVPMSVWWLLPQYIMFGIMDVFTMVGLQEFFYDQVPKELRSVGIALYLSVFGVGSFLSGFMVSVIDKASSEKGGESWFSNNLNKASLHYFYWLLAGLSALGFATFLHFSRLYVYNRRVL
jgi:peptide/histidine transporter 3/4